TTSDLSDVFPFGRALNHDVPSLAHHGSHTAFRPTDSNRMSCDDFKKRTTMSRHLNRSTAHRLLNPAPVAGAREASPNPEGRGRPSPAQERHPSGFQDFTPP